MATVQVKVPIGGNEKERTGWIENISQHIDAGNDVEFIDENGSANVDIARLQCDTAGSVCIWGRNMTSAQAKTVALVAGGFHVIGGIHGIRAAGTSTSIGIHAKI